MDLRAVETGGLSIGKRLVRPDMKSVEPCGRPGCVLDLDSGGAGGPHNVPSNVYRGVCKLCGEVEVTAEYWGESAFSGFSGCGGEERVQCLQQTHGNFPSREPGRHFEL